jgi:hypothetical protein
MSHHVVDAEYRTTSFERPNHSIGFLKTKGDWLFAERALSAGGGGDTYFRMSVGRGNHMHDLDRWILNEILPVMVGGRPNRSRRSFRKVEPNISYSGNLEVRLACIRFDTKQAERA